MHAVEIAAQKHRFIVDQQVAAIVRYLPVAVACGHDILVIPGPKLHLDLVGGWIELAPGLEGRGIEGGLRQAVVEAYRAFFVDH